MSNTASHAEIDSNHNFCRHPDVQGYFDVWSQHSRLFHFNSHDDVLFKVILFSSKFRIIWKQS